MLLAARKGAGSASWAVLRERCERGRANWSSLAIDTALPGVRAKEREPEPGRLVGSRGEGVVGIRSVLRRPTRATPHPSSPSAEKSGQVYNSALIVKI